MFAFTFVTLVCMITGAMDDFKTAYCLDYAPKDINGGGKAAFSLDFCRSTKINGTDVKCCYLRYEDKNEKRKYNCFPATADNLVDIDDTIDYLEDKFGYDVKSLDCNSRYLYAPLILFAILFLI